MADFADDAADIQQRQIDLALANHAAANKVTVRHFCEDCDAVIPPERIKAMNGRSITRCLSCQEDHELIRRTRGGA